jgi:hypothetical protein
MFFPKLKMGSVVGGAVIAAATLGAAPSQAVITTFASYSAIGTSSNVYWKNNGSNGTTNGTGGSIYTIASGTTTPGTSQISFSFLQSALAPVTNVTANFTLLASVTNSPVLTAGGFKIEQLISGSFSIKSTSAITIGSTTLAAGANLLSGAFNQATIFGATNATSGSFSSATTSGATITYTSDFLDFLPTLDRDFALSLTSITGGLNNNTNRALRTFAALSTGSFSSDPAPTPLYGVPESATWAMFISGFGLMGASMRRRRTAQSLA